MFFNWEPKISVFWDKIPCSPVKTPHHFGGTYRLHLQRRRVSSACSLLHAGFLLGLLIDPEDGGDIFLRNIDFPLPDYMALYSRREHCKNLKSNKELSVLCGSPNNVGAVKCTMGM
jgi:hypothetical protein